METIINNPGVGIDVGKSELVTCIRHSNGATEPPVAFANSSIGFRKFVVHLTHQAIHQDTPILLESTGPYHWDIARYLADQGYVSKVVNPLHTKQIARYSIRKRKTDKIDAGQLAFLASQNYGYPFVETKELAKKKALVRHYWKLKAVIGNLSKHERYLKQYRGVTSPVVTPYLLTRCDSLKKRIVQDWEKGNRLKYLDSIPGITPFLGATLLAELEPLERFQRTEQIIAFAGLDPSVKQTGGKAGTHGPLSKRGSRVLRTTLYLAAFGAFRHSLRPLYDGYRKRGLHHSETLCILARKILRIAIAVLRKRQMFDPRYLEGIVDKT